MNLESILKKYLSERPLFLSLIRAKEAELYQKYLPLKKPVLDVGCGDGFFVKVTFRVRPLARLRSDPIRDLRPDPVIDVGLDLKDSRIEEAKQLNIYKKLVIYNGRKIPLPNNSFSTVISNCVLEHVSDLYNVVKEVNRVLKPEGTFLTTVMAKPWEENLFGTKIIGGAYKEWMRKRQLHRNLLSRTEWDQMFQRAGFTIKESTGYLNPQACAVIDLSHYLSIPSLISYKLFGRWILFEGLAVKLIPVKYLVKVLSEKVLKDESGAIF